MPEALSQLYLWFPNLWASNSFSLSKSGQLSMEALMPFVFVVYCNHVLFAAGFGFVHPLWLVMMASNSDSEPLLGRASGYVASDVVHIYIYIYIYFRNFRNVRFSDMKIHFPMMFPHFSFLFFEIFWWCMRGQGSRFGNIFAVPEIIQKVLQSIRNH